MLDEWQLFVALPSLLDENLLDDEGETIAGGHAYRSLVPHNLDNTPILV